jgi:hypothetical protein
MLRVIDTMRRRFPTARENYPSCSSCSSPQVQLTRLAFESASFRCESCGATWDVVNDEVELDRRLTRQRVRAERPAGG